MVGDGREAEMLVSGQDLRGSSWCYTTVVLISSWVACELSCSIFWGKGALLSSSLPEWQRRQKSLEGLKAAKWLMEWRIGEVRIFFKSCDRTAKPKSA